MDPKLRLPDFYYNTYRQYKENESKIVRWVHVTAAELRKRARVLATPSSGTRGRPQANKARNGQKKAHTVTDPDLSSPKFSLRTFINLVQEIAASDVAIPQTYLTLLELSIKQRKLTAAFYSPDATASATNKSHLHAIQSYSQALDILKEAQKKRADADKSLASKLQKALTLHVAEEDSIFALSEALQQLGAALEEETLTHSASTGSPDNEWLRDNPMVNSSKSQGKAKKVQPFPLEEYKIVADDYFETKSQFSKAKRAHDNTFEALRCFLLDVHDMRKYCNKVWNSVVPVGQTSHIAASVVTTKAVQFIKQMEYALLADFPELKDMDHAYEMLLEVITSQMPGAKNVDSYPFKEQMMYYTWQNLLSFADVLKDSPSPVMRDGFWGYFDPRADRQAMSVFEKQLEDRCIMLNHWPDLIVANNPRIFPDNDRNFKFPGSQGLAEEFKAFSGNKERPITWALIFACQMHLDSVHARRRHLKYDVQVMRNLGAKMRQEYADFLNDGVLYDSNMDYTAKPCIEASDTDVCNWLVEDHITGVKVKNGWHKLSSQATQKDALWIQNPWLTANAMASASFDFFLSGTTVVGAGGFVQSAIQMWNILKQTGYLPPSPPVSSVASRNLSKEGILLFDHLMDVFGDKVFSGPPPKSHFIKAWDIMMGVRPEDFARDKRQTRKTATTSSPLRSRAKNEAGRGIMVTISDLWNMHDAKYFTTSDSQKRASKADYKHPLAATLDLANSELGQSATLLSQDKFVPRGPLLNLNLFKIHRLCVRLFTELEPLLRPRIELIIGQPLEHTQINWPYLTGWIARTEEIPSNNGVPDRTMLKLAVGMFQKLAMKELGFFLMREEADEGLIL